MWTEEFFLELEGAKNAPTAAAWVDEFCTYWLTRVVSFAPCIKHPAFKDEKEWRLIYHVRPEDQGSMKILQRQSMLSRHMPLRLNKPLPLTEVLVGPCRHPRLSQVAVAGLLSGFGFDPSVVKVSITGVLYRTVQAGRHNA